MAQTTFNGPVRSQNGFQNVSISATTGTATTTSSYGDAEVVGVQSLSGAGAVDVTNGLTSLTSTGSAQALTLANGSVGQVKYIVHAVDGGSAVLTPTTKIGFTTITFTAVGDAATLVYTAAGWAVVGSKGVTIA